MDKEEIRGGTDWFWANTTRPAQSSMAGFGIIGVCRSECIQNGKACPIYETCMQKNMIRDILP